MQVHLSLTPGYRLKIARISRMSERRAAGLADATHSEAQFTPIYGRGRSSASAHLHIPE